MIALFNGIKHPTRVVVVGPYVPGVATASVLLVLALYLDLRLWQGRNSSAKIRSPTRGCGGRRKHEVAAEPHR